MILQSLIHLLGGLFFKFTHLYGMLCLYELLRNKHVDNFNGGPFCSKMKIFSATKIASWLAELAQ